MSINVLNYVNEEKLLNNKDVEISTVVRIGNSGNIVDKDYNCGEKCYVQTKSNDDGKTFELYFLSFNK